MGKSILHPIASRALLVAVVLAALPACYWLRYHDLMTTHVELMESLAVGAAETLVAAGPGLTPGDIERLAYPLDRAGQFAEIARRRYASRASMAEFDGFVAAYAELYAHLDRVRASELDAAAIERTRSLVAGVRERGELVRGALARERG